MNKQRDRFKFQNEFPNYGKMDVEIPDDFDDASWHNDTCPRFECEKRNLGIWINFADKGMREDPDAPRFTVTEFNYDSVLFRTDSWDEVIARVNRPAVGILTVTVEGTPNPDYDQHHMIAPLREVNVDSIEQAQKTCRVFIEAHGLGGGNWGPKAGIVKRDGEIIGHVSYNGRWWPTA